MYYLKSSLSFSQFPMNVPYSHEWMWSCKVNRNRSLNWKVSGNCCINCQVASRSWVKTGEISLTSLCMWPQRSLNLWPKANQSFSINAYKMQLQSNNCTKVTIMFNIISVNSQVVKQKVQFLNTTTKNWKIITISKNCKC